MIQADINRGVITRNLRARELRARALHERAQEFFLRDRVRARKAFMFDLTQGYDTEIQTVIFILTPTLSDGPSNIKYLILR